MTYLLLIVESRGQRDTRTQPRRKGFTKKWCVLARVSPRAAYYWRANPLRSDQAGVRVQISDDKTQLRDGPFAEAREMVDDWRIFYGQLRHAG